MPVWLWVVLGLGCVGLPAIVAILAAILFPVFAQARGKARETSCMSNMKMLGLSNLMYAQDYDEVMPKATQWMTDTKPYAANDHSYRCPVVVTSDPQSYGYAFNSNLSQLPLSKVVSPQATCVLFESSNTTADSNDPMTSLVTPYRHNGKNVFTYVDGHVKSIREGDPLPSASP